MIRQVKCGIIGTPSFKDEKQFNEALDKLIEEYKYQFTAIVVGGAPGADTLAKKYAEKNNVQLIDHLPDYNKYQIDVTLKRSTLIIEDSDIIIAFWDNKSGETKNSMIEAEKREKELYIIYV